MRPSPKSAAGYTDHPGFEEVSSFFVNHRSSMGTDFLRWDRFQSNLSSSAVGDVAQANLLNIDAFMPSTPRKVRLQRIGTLVSTACLNSARISVLNSWSRAEDFRV
jgi:hypothetical protein